MKTTKHCETSPSTSSETPSYPQFTEVHYVLTIIVCTTFVAFSVNISSALPVSFMSSISLLNICLLIGAYLMLVRSNSPIPNTGLTFLISFWSIIIFNLSSHMAFIGLPFCLVLPPVVLWLTKSYMHCITSLFVQLINISLLFRVNLEESIKYLPVEKLTERLVQCLTLGCFLVLLTFGYAFRAKTEFARGNDSLKATQTPGEQTEASNAEKRLLNSYISEVKNVLQTISGSLELLRTHMEPGLGMKLVKIANLSTDKLQRIIYNMTDMKDEEIENRQSVPVFTNLQSFFNSFWESSLLQLSQKGIEGTCKIDRSLPDDMELDVTRVKQVLSNLIDYFIHISPSSAPVETTIEPARLIGDQNFFGFMALPEEIAALKTEDSFSDSVSGYLNTSGTLRLMNRGEKMLKVTIKSIPSRENSENYEDMLNEIDEEDLPFKASSDMVKLGVNISKKICKKLGGKLRIYRHGKQGTAFVAYIPYETTPEVKAQCSKWSLW